ncbi:Uncharacterized protein dnm_035160 [Desulfonema magnum]|uniref:Uncharacterized protein n=1 Tax=Desulfonema magnum TaxID=45655 RepID=A0A975BLI6_9BACT|nr:Uncharacterized protein dnm_035160 [Desulfonema magnum]
MQKLSEAVFCSGYLKNSGKTQKIASLNFCTPEKLFDLLKILSCFVVS